jgi:hypothetical protein
MTTLFGPDPMTVCLPIEFDSCVECTDHKECGSGEGFCVEVAEGEGKACLFPCSAAKGCAAAFSCGGVDVGGGQAVDLCIPVTASCTCLPGSDGDERECTRENEYGICIGQEACDGEQGWSECDAAFPGQEVCDGKDNNCNGQVDEGYPDTDQDGLADCVDQDDDNDGDPDETDCAPLVPSIYHGAPEACDGIDNNCDGKIDEGYPDTNGDGIADCSETGWDSDDDGDPDLTDCAPEDPTVHHGAVEVCDGIDNDCDGQVDEGCPCSPDCKDKVCGDDGCSGSCGTCPEGTKCNESGKCE